MKLEELMKKPLDTWDDRLRAACGRAPFLWKAWVVQGFEDNSERRKRMYDRTLAKGNVANYERSIEIPFDETAFVPLNERSSLVPTFSDDVRWAQSHYEGAFRENVVSDLSKRGVDEDLAHEIAHFVSECIHDAIDVGSCEVLSRLASADELLCGSGSRDPDLLSRMLHDKSFYLHLCRVIGVWTTDMQYRQD